jgi:hypothetical protein
LFFWRVYRGIEIEKGDNLRIKFESLIRVWINCGDDGDGIRHIENLSLCSSWICGEFSISCNLTFTIQNNDLSLTQTYRTAMMIDSFTHKIGWDIPLLHKSDICEDEKG